MIDDTLMFLKDSLNAYILGNREPADFENELPVRFLANQETDVVKFTRDKITLLLINIEQENILRAANPHVRITQDGVQQAIHPDIRLNLYILFVAQYNEYRTSLSRISRVIEFFQRHRVFNHDNSPTLSDKLEQLVVELVTLPFAEQNEIWSALRTAYQPSVLYKIKMIVFRDEDLIGGPEIQQIDQTTRVLPR